jgi:IS5 family transposase
MLKPGHSLIKLADSIDWAAFDEAFGPLYSAYDGAPGKPIRLMVGLTYLKHIYNHSDEKTVAIWCENPYWQYFCGSDVFGCDDPSDPSLLSRFVNALVMVGWRPSSRRPLSPG